jgi:hypothetical protein
MFGLAICMVLLDYPVILGFFRKGGRGTYKKKSLRYARLCRNSKERHVQK